MIAILNSRNRKVIEPSSNKLANRDVSNKNNIENTNSKNSEFCIDNHVTNNTDINKVMDENPCKIYQESDSPCCGKKSRHFINNRN